MNLLILYTTFSILINFTNASPGDRSAYYGRCLEKCLALNCTDDYSYVSSQRQPLYLKLTFWSCPDECKYQCMWKTVNIFHENNFMTPQFYGKWPFVRFLGIQEPASTAFSLLNLYQHITMIKRFRKEVRPDSLFYWLWHFFCVVCCHAWVWSTLFHIRDISLTEFMDYACAFSIILVNCYVMVVRLLTDKVPRFVIITISTFFLAFFANHVLYLSQDKFDYGYNMELNLIVGTFTGISWFGWCIYNRVRQFYVWKCAIYVALTGVFLLLEILDIPPLFYIIDSHALWHLLTAPLVALFYSFAIDDCKHLRRKTVENNKIINYKKM